MSRTILSTAALVLGLVSVLPAWAAVDRAQAATLAQRVAPGRVLAVERGVYLDNSIIWRVQVLTGTGEVRVVIIDAETGRSR